VPRVTRATDSLPSPLVRPAPRSPSAVASPPRGSAKLPPVVKPRQPHEDTRQLDQPAPPDPLRDDSGLLTPDGQKLSWIDSDRSATSDDIENIGERTLITAAPGMSGTSGLGFMMDVAGDDGDGQIEATLVTAAPTGFGLDAGQDSTAGVDGPAASAGDAGDAGDADDDEDGPTLSRDFSRDHPTKPARRTLKTPPPAALAAKIHAPAVSELRKPRPSRRTPPGGTPFASPGASPNVLQAIVASKASEPMPVPRAPTPVPRAPTPPPSPSPSAMHATMAMPPSQAMPAAMPQPAMAHGTMPQTGMPGGMLPGTHAQTHPYGVPPFPIGTPSGPQPSYNHDASGLPLGIPTPPGVNVPAPSGHYQIPGGPAAIPPVHPGYIAHPMATQVPPGYPQMSPNALYGMQAPPQPASLTGQLRWSEVDEIPSQYKLGAARRRWFTYIVSGLIAVSVAAGVTFLIIRLTREATPTTGSVHVVSVPAGADVSFDGTLLADRTPVTIDGAPVGTRHKIVVSLRHYQPYAEEVAIPKVGGPVQVMAQLTSQTGKIVINTTPGGAQIWINGQPRGTTPTTLSGIDIDSTATIELLHKDFGKHAVPLKWDAAGVAYVDYKFSH
jgi:hypothetical protein